MSKWKTETKEVPPTIIASKFSENDIAKICTAAAAVYSKAAGSTQKEYTYEQVRDRLENPIPHNDYIKPQATKDYLMDKVFCMTVDYLKILL